MLEGIPPAPRGTPQIEVSFDIDTNGILEVSAMEKGTGKRSNIQIKNDKGRLSKEDIERMVQESERFKADDDKYMELLQTRNELEAAFYEYKNRPDADEEKVSTTQSILDDDNASLEEMKTRVDELRADPPEMEPKIEEVD
jgi:L1 cell adhesion molecule like protein